MIRPRRRPLRARVYAVILAVVAAPLMVVLGGALLGSTARGRMRASVESAARAMARDPARDEAVAVREGVRARRIDASGRVVSEVDHEPASRLHDRAGDLFFGPRGAPTLRGWERTQAPLVARDEVQRARWGEVVTVCDVGLQGSIEVCRVALPLGEGRVLLVEKSAPRAIRALWDLRWPLVKLTVLVLLVASVLAAWLARRMTRPLERLRDEVRARADAPLDAAPVTIGGQDEIAEVAEAFNRLLGAVRERSAQTGAFMADLAHEVKSPVAAVRAAAEALATGAPVDPERAVRLARALTASSARLDAVVTEFLALARAEAGLPQDSRVPIDLAELARNIADGMRDDPRRADVRVTVDASPAPVLASHVELERAVRNLLDNALSFAGDGGEVVVTTRAEEGACVLTVRDSGPGIAPDKLPRVFERFFTDRRDGRGTGLGLALARAVAVAHGGSLDATNAPDRGAVFTLRLPRRPHDVHTASDDVSHG